MNSFLLKGVNEIPGIGASKSDVLFSELGIKSVFDLLQSYPFRYVDRTQVHDMQADFLDGDYVQFKGKLSSLQTIGVGHTKRLSAKLIGENGSIDLVWFRSIPFLEKTLKPGESYLVFGRINNFKGRLSIPHPEMELEGPKSHAIESHFVPIYPNTEKLTKKGLDSRARSKIIRDLLSRLTPSDFPEFLPEYIRKTYLLPSFSDTIQRIHFPKNNDEINSAKRRIKFEELFFMQLGLLKNQVNQLQKVKGNIFEKLSPNFLEFYNHHLPFPLTNAQKKVLKEIRSDLAKGIQMNRLLQGDVGSGKTIVAFLTMLMALDNGFQACLLAPTEILANQHFISISEYASKINLKVELLTGSIRGKRRKAILEELEQGQISILIGTHAILEDSVIFQNLGLAITDEQHRFGVAQRAKLWQKAKPLPPHVLVMTATPIPRTLAMTLYGDLDISIIDEMPPGRKDILTSVKYEGHRTEVLRFIKAQIDQGRQIYVVYPLIEESEKMDLEDLQRGYDFLERFFPPPHYHMSMLHGKMKSEDKDAAMQRFVQGQTHIMVATTVIEVGVNVPNASVMIIENAERFGLSALHQLRGRVGRGADQSYCILMSSHKVSKDGKERLKTMVATNNGFEIAEVDLRLRGPGALDGLKQSGLPELKMADLSQDTAILTTARDLCKQILEKDPQLALPIHAPLIQYFRTFKDKSHFWGRVS